MFAYDENRSKTGVINGVWKRKVALGSDLVVARVEVPPGTITSFRVPEGERIVIVLRGAWRLRLPTGEVTLRAHQMLVIPSGVKYLSEALEQTEAIEICTQTPTDGRASQERQQHYDSDQYLWGV